MIKRATLFFSLVFMVSMLALVAYDPPFVGAQQDETFQEQRALLEDERNTIEVVELYGKSVVAVNVEVRGQRIDPFEEFFEGLPRQFRDQLREFFEFPRQLPEPRQHGTGSGFVIDEGGRLITNFHVVQGALEPGSVELREGAAIEVVFEGDDTAKEARVVGANPDYDLALLELVDATLPDGAKAIPLARSADVRVGQKVIAIGNPFGLQSTVTTGIVSAVGRELTSIGRVEVPMIQTDAAINPGNSGGPLLNSKGELVGINTAIVPGRDLAGRPGFIGIGFAVPSDLLAESLANLELGGLSGFAAERDAITERPRIGIRIAALEDYPEEVKSFLDLPEQGVIIVQTEPDSPAAEAGLRGAQFAITAQGSEWAVGGDVILEVDGTEVTTADDVVRAVLDRDEGDRVVLTVLRDGEEIEVEVTLAVVPVDEG